MKITEETKIKDLIPEGYELDYDSIDKYCSKGVPIVGSLLGVSVKKKEVKDFKWYCREYSKKVDYFDPIREVPFKSLEDELKSVPFEFKIGLLKFICDDLKDDILMILTLIRAGQSNMTKTGKICPPEFLNSIFK